MYDITCELHSIKGRVNIVNPAVQLKTKCKLVMRSMKSWWN